MKKGHMTNYHLHETKLKNFSHTEHYDFKHVHSLRTWVTISVTTVKFIVGRKPWTAVELYPIR